MSLHSQLKPLPKPVYLVFKGGSEFRDVFEKRDNPPAMEEVFPGFPGDTTATWLLQTFLQLTRRGLNVHLVDRLVPDRICVSGIWQIGKGSLLVLPDTLPCNRKRKTENCYCASEPETRHRHCE